MLVPTSPTTAPVIPENVSNDRRDTSMKPPLAFFGCGVQFGVHTCDCFPLQANIVIGGGILKTRHRCMVGG